MPLQISASSSSEIAHRYGNHVAVRGIPYLANFMRGVDVIPSARWGVQGNQSLGTVF